MHRWAAVLHHLRDEAMAGPFRKLYRWLRPGGSLWIFDLVSHEIEAVQLIMWERYGDYLAAFKGEEYRDHVFAYVDHEDSPRPVLLQCEQLREARFREIDILHQNTGLAALCAVSRSNITASGGSSGSAIQARNAGISASWRG